MKMKWLTFFTFLLFPLAILAATPAQPISSDEAFQFSATAKDDQTIIGIWDIKPGYYLYRNRISFLPLKPHQDRLGQPLWPQTQIVKNYPGFGQMAVYTGHLEIPVPILSHGEQTILIKVSYQGCSAAGFCYPPTSKTVQINLTSHYNQPVQPITIDLMPGLEIPNNIGSSASLSTQNKVLQLLTQHNLFTILFSFFVLGLLLSLTPCVLPMIPILSSI